MDKRYGFYGLVLCLCVSTAAYGAEVIVAAPVYPPAPVYEEPVYASPQLVYFSPYPEYYDVWHRHHDWQYWREHHYHELHAHDRHEFRHDHYDHYHHDDHYDHY